MSRREIESVQELRNLIGSNWYNEEGFCSTCGINDNNGGFKPDFGGFNPQAEIMIVGHTPGEGDFTGENRTRRYLQYPENIDKSKQTSEEIIHSMSEYSSYILDEWEFFDDLRYLFGIEKNPDDSSPKPDNRSTLGHPSDSIYYTNFLKCSKLSKSAKRDKNDKTGMASEEISCRNKSGYNSCCNYLDLEIHEVSPSIIALFLSEPGWLEFKRIYDIDAPDNIKRASQAEDTDAVKRHRTYSVTFNDSVEVPVMPLYHWSLPNYSNYDWYEKGAGAAYYYSTLAEDLISYCDNSSESLAD
jgi:uracil-DNA glycosylase